MSATNPYADQLNIDTPEQVALRFPLAGIGSRFLAVLIDHLLQLVIILILFFIVYLTSLYHAFSQTLNHSTATGGKWLLALLTLSFFLIYWGYFLLFEAYWKGQTPGKHVMKLRVLKDSGRGITLFESMTRNLIRIVDLLPNLYLAGLITMLCNKQNKRLGDYAAGTIVVHERTESQPFLSHHSRTFTSSFATPPTQQTMTPRAQADWDAASLALPADAIARLQPADLHIIDSFFNRALDLSIDKRAELGLRVAQQMAGKMRFPLPPDMRAEQMLELIAHKMRGGR